MGKEEPAQSGGAVIRPSRNDPVAVPLLLTGSSIKEGAIVAQSGETQETGHTHHVPVTRREVVCFDCHADNKASAKATSTQCANCGTFIDLRDVEIRGRSTQRIRTRGKVTIHKKGALLGTAIHCGSLLVEGSIVGSVYAQDTVEFRTDAKVVGEIRCRRLIVERRCHVQGLQPIHVDFLELSGSLTARVLVKGLAEIMRHARFEGGLYAAGLKMEAGAEVLSVLAIGGKSG